MTVANQRELMLLQIQMTEVMTQNAQLMAKIKMRQMKRRQNAKEKAEEKRREAEEKRRKEVSGYESGCKEDRGWANIQSSLTS